MRGGVPLAGLAILFVSVSTVGFALLWLRQHLKLWRRIHPKSSAIPAAVHAASAPTKEATTTHTAASQVESAARFGHAALGLRRAHAPRRASQSGIGSQSRSKSRSVRSALSVRGTHLTSSPIGIHTPIGIHSPIGIHTPIADAARVKSKVVKLLERSFVVGMP